MTTLLSLTLATFASPSSAASTGTPEGIQLVAVVRTAFPNANKGEYQLAQASDSCRQVAANNGVYVRQEPTVYSTALGAIASGRYVTIIEDGGTKDWVPISAPLKGYVFADYLRYCS